LVLQMLSNQTHQKKIIEIIDFNNFLLVSLIGFECKAL
jgi:hypothetical protein